MTKIASGDLKMLKLQAEEIRKRLLQIVFFR